MLWFHIIYIYQYTRKKHKSDKYYFTKVRKKIGWNFLAINKVDVHDHWSLTTQIINFMITFLKWLDMHNKTKHACVENWHQSVLFYKHMCILLMQVAVQILFPKSALIGTGHNKKINMSHSDGGVYVLDLLSSFGFYSNLNVGFFIIKWNKISVFRLTINVVSHKNFHLAWIFIRN